MKSLRTRLPLLIAALLSLNAQPTKAAVNVITDTPQSWEWTFDGVGNTLSDDLFSMFPYLWSNPFANWALVEDTYTIQTGDVSAYDLSITASHYGAGGDPMTVNVSGLFGETHKSSIIIPHGTGQDSLTLRFGIVQGQGDWIYSGSVAAAHREASVPDAAATSSLLGLGLAAVGLVRSRLRRA